MEKSECSTCGLKTIHAHSCLPDLRYEYKTFKRMTELLAEQLQKANGNGWYIECYYKGDEQPFQAHGPGTIEEIYESLHNVVCNTIGGKIEVKITQTPGCNPMALSESNSSCEV